MMKRGRGNYTTSQIYRCSHLGGDYRKEIDRVFLQAWGLGQEHYRKKKPPNYNQDLQRFVREFQEDALFHYIPPRSHSAFENFVCTTSVREPRKLGKRLRALSEELDFWRRRQRERAEGYGDEDEDEDENEHEDED